jgi:NAD(P)-dependent dehydrogenase (short-subunit alcohol dehydrogenase family)
VTTDDLPGNDFSSVGNYSKSKLANVQFTVGLADRVTKYPNIKVMSLHPGIVDSDFASRTPFCSLIGIFKCLCCCCYINTETGARTSLFLSRENFANLRSGEFYDSDTTLGNMNPLGRNREHVERLWKTSEQLFKIEFSP